MTPADVPRAPEHRLCPHCGAGLAPDQDWCLECGTAATTRVVAPPSWKVPVAVVAAVLAAFAVAVLIAVSVLSGDAERSVAPVDPAARTATPAAPAAERAPARTATAEDDRAAEAATGETGATGAEDKGATGATGAVGIWDEEKEQYTVVLITSDRDGAEKVAEDIGKETDAPTGVLDTTKYEFFSPNLWIAWAGEFEEKPDAQKLADELSQKTGRSGYVTLVKRK